MRAREVLLSATVTGITLGIGIGSALYPGRESPIISGFGAGFCAFLIVYFFAKAGRRFSEKLGVRSIFTLVGFTIAGASFLCLSANPNQLIEAAEFGAIGGSLIGVPMSLLIEIIWSRKVSR